MAHDHPSLSQDLDKMLATAANRRQSLRWLFAGAAALPLASCGGGSDSGTASVSAGTSSSGATGTTGSTGTTGGTGGTGSTGTNVCSVIPEETGGPYPGDGTNRNASGVANALTLSGIVRSDIRASVGGASGVAPGIPLTIRLQLVNVAANCAAAAGAAVYLWHCTRDGLYSMYSSAVANENFLRGVQEADSQGVVTFQSIFPGCYDGRMPHVHFEVYPTLAKANLASNRVKTSQFAFPQTTSQEAYATAGYSASVANLARISFASDNVFSDGVSLQMASVTGNPTQGYVATLTVGVSL